jgi:carbamate kinase
VRIVVALGGNALLRRGEPLTAETQARNVARAAEALRGIADGNELLIVHGSGPHVGLLALQDAERPDRGGFPLDVLNAQTIGMVGYPVAQALENLLPGRTVTSLLTRVEVDPDDPAFDEPTKPIGPVYGEEDARRLGEEKGWVMGRDGEGWRRLVASPRPVRILEREVIRLLVDHGVVLLCAGGGGIPVVVDAEGRARGVEAIVDKDRSAGLVARAVDADAFLLLTDVEAVQVGWGTDEARPLEEIRAEEARALELPAGSMGPKVEAAADFAAEPSSAARRGRASSGVERCIGPSGRPKYIYS